MSVVALDELAGEETTLEALGSGLVSSGFCFLSLVFTSSFLFLSSQPGSADIRSEAKRLVTGLAVRDLDILWVALPSVVLVSPVICNSSRLRTFALNFRLD